MRSRLEIKQYCVRKIRKIRHRKGYGVHSPFAYNLITKVIEEKSGYYAYQQIEDLRRSMRKKRGRNRRKYRLLFRLANRFKPENIIECGCGDGYAALYLHKGCPSARLFCIEPDARQHAAARQLLSHIAGQAEYITHTIPEGLSTLRDEGIEAHLIYLHRLSDAAQYRQAFEHIAPLLNEKTVLIVDGIRQRKEIFRTWQEFISHETIRVTFDLYNIGLSTCNPKLNRQSYIVAF